MFDWDSNNSVISVTYSIRLITAYTYMDTSLHLILITIDLLLLPLLDRTSRVLD